MKIFNLELTEETATELKPCIVSELGRIRQIIINNQELVKEDDYKWYITREKCLQDILDQLNTFLEEYDRQRTS